MKAEYDRDYRANNGAILKAKKAAAYAVSGPKNRDKERDRRTARMPKHIEYCRRPEYRKKKVVYDRIHRAKEQFGEFAEAFLVLKDVQAEINSRMDWYERAKAKGTINKTKQRRRDYERITGQTQRD